MALIERLMKDPSEPETRYIPVHDFFAACGEVMQGALTSVQVQGFLNMTPEDLIDWNALVALIPSTTTGKALYIERIHGVFILAERKYPGYDTPTNVRVKLGI